MIKCLIVDDEPLARQLLENYVMQVEFLQLVGSCKSAVEAFTMLHEHEVDLILLDIQMPGITGINFLQSLKNPPKVIFTTAYKEYAVDAFELEAVDYLLKPIVFERFQKAISKLQQTSTSAKGPEPEQENEYLFIKVSRRLVKIKMNDILYIESLGDYVKVISNTQEYV